MKIGIFDSGLGGLTVLKSILSTIDNIEAFYIADTAFAPYGDKSSEEILKRCQTITQYFIDKYSVDAIVVACNTATSVAIEQLRKNYENLIIVGTEPGVKPAIELTKSCKIGVLATSATLKGSKYQDLVKELSKRKKYELFEVACIGLVEQIENGEINSKKTYDMLYSWLKPLKHSSVDTIVLGCTHYPLVEHIIRDILEDDINIIQTGNAIANRLKSLIQTKNIVDSKKNIQIEYTGKINKNMIKQILNSVENIRECSI